MKKISSAFSFVAAAVSYLALSVPSYAATSDSICPPSTSQFSALCNLKLNAGSSIVGNIVVILLVLAVLLALFFLILGGIRWITSGGDKAKLESARGTITSAIVGLIVAFLAFFILTVITFVFTNKGITNFTIPTLVP